MAVTPQRWAPVLAYCGAAAVTQMVWLTFAPVATSAAEHYGVSEQAIGWLAQPFVLLYVVLAIPAGVLLDRRFGRWLSFGALLTALGALVRVVDTYPALLVGAVLASIAQPFVLNAVTSVVAQNLPESRRPLGIAIGSASIFGGMVVAFGLGIAFSQPAQVGTLVGVQAALAALAAVLLVAALARPAPYPPAAAQPGFGAFRTAWSTPLVRRLCLFLFLPYGAFVAITTWAEVLLEPAGVTTDEAGVALVVMVLMGVVGSATLPVWAARRRKELALAAAAAAVLVVACLALAVAPGFVVALVGLSAVGLVVLAVLPVVLELVERGSLQAEGTASGLIFLAGNLGGAVVSAVIGLLSGTPAWAFAALALMVLASVPLLLRLRAPVAALPPVGISPGPSSRARALPRGRAGRGRRSARPPAR